MRKRSDALPLEQYKYARGRKQLLVYSKFLQNLLFSITAKERRCDGGSCFTLLSEPRSIHKLQHMTLHVKKLVV